MPMMTGRKTNVAAKTGSNGKSITVGAGFLKQSAKAGEFISLLLNTDVLKIDGPQVRLLIFTNTSEKKGPNSPDYNVRQVFGDAKRTATASRSRANDAAVLESEEF